MVRKGKNRSRDQGCFEANQIIWTWQFGDPQVDSIDTSTNLGAFTWENFGAVTILKKELDRKKEEVKKLEEELARI